MHLNQRLTLNKTEITLSLCGEAQLKAWALLEKRQFFHVPAYLYPAVIVIFIGMKV